MVELHVSLIAICVVTGMPQTDLCFEERTIVWARGTVVTNKSELHHQHGSLWQETWLPGIVAKGFLKVSPKGKMTKHIDATFCHGEGDTTKQAEVSLSQAPLDCPSHAH